MQKIKIGNQNNIKLAQKNKFVLKLADISEMSDKNFNIFISETESSSVFKKLKDIGAIKRTVNFVEKYGSHIALNENIIKDSTIYGLDQLIAKRKNTIGIIRKIGEENFKNYFLYDISGKSDPEIKDILGINQNELQEIKSLVNELMIMSETAFPSGCASRSVSYEKIAALEKDESGNISVVFYSLHLLRGKYLIDYEKMKTLKKENCFSKRDLEEIKILFEKINLINMRKMVLYRLLEIILKTESVFLRTADLENIQYFTQKDLAESIGVHRTTISRILKRKSISLPWKEEVPLGLFVLSRSDIRKSITEKIILKYKREMSARRIMEKIIQEHGEYIPLRTINYYKKIILRDRQGKE